MATFQRTASGLPLSRRLLLATLLMAALGWPLLAALLTAVAFGLPLQVRGLRGEKHNTNILEFHRTLTALVRHSFEMGFGVASPAELLPASKRDADCITYRELVVDDDDDDDTPQQQDTFRAALRQMLPEARQPMRSVPEDDEVSEDGTGRSDVVWLPLVKSTAAAPAGSSDPLVA